MRMWEFDRGRAGLAVFLAALGARLIVLALSGATFDPDEFVVLALGRAVTHGAVPYYQLTYYHPPGMLYLAAAVDPLTQWWWPASRLVMLVVDSATAALVWHVARKLYEERTARIAGLLYAVSPLCLISATRVGPDPIVTFLGLLGLSQMLREHSRWGPILAGICLGLAVWTKYPALLFLPVYVLAARRSAARMLAAFGLTTVGLFAPFLVHARDLYADTVLWQLTRAGGADLMHRLTSVGTYWFALNVLSVVGLLRRPHPRWLQVGFCSGALFLLTAHAYYHYFVPIVPFAALLAAPVVRPAIDRAKSLIIAGAIATTVLWALDVEYGPPAARLFVTAFRMSSAQATAQVIDRATPARSRILTDQLEYPLLARRGALNYFWDMDGSVSAARLERQLGDIAAVVETTGTGRLYPEGFIDYLEDRKLPQVRTAGAIVWIIPRRDAD